MNFLFTFQNDSRLLPSKIFCWLSCIDLTMKLCVFSEKRKRKNVQIVWNNHNINDAWINKFELRQMKFHVCWIINENIVWHLFQYCIRTLLFLPIFIFNILIIERMSTVLNGRKKGKKRIPFNVTIKENVDIFEFDNKAIWRRIWTKTILNKINN